MEMPLFDPSKLQTIVECKLLWSMWSRIRDARPERCTDVNSIVLRAHTTPHELHHTLIPMNQAQPLRGRTWDELLRSQRLEVISKDLSTANPELYCHAERVTDWTGVWLCRMRNTNVEVYVDTKGRLPLAAQYDHAEHAFYYAVNNLMSKEQVEATINTLGQYDSTGSIIIGGLLLLLRFKAKYQQVEFELAKEKKKEKQQFEQPLFIDAKRATNKFFVRLLESFLKKLPELNLQQMDRFPWETWLYWSTDSNKYYDQEAQPNRVETQRMIDELLQECATDEDRRAMSERIKLLHSIRALLHSQTA